MGLASLLAFGERRGHWAKRLASLGYATPGAVMAVGLLAPASLVWQGLGGMGGGVATSLGLLLSPMRRG